MKHINFHGKIEVFAKKTIHKGFLRIKKLTLRHTLFNGKWSKKMTREVVYGVRAVGVLLFDPQNCKILLIEQCRPVIHEAGEYAWLMEIVVGRSDTDESLTEAAHREVLEETGCTVHKLIPIIDYYPSVGWCTEKIKLYCGLFASEGTDNRISGLEEENENIKTCLIDAQLAFQYVTAGKIDNSASIIALQWLQINYKKLTRVS